MKVGMDDFLTAHTTDDLLALAQPWDRGESVRRDHAGDDLSLAATLKHIIFHPEYTLADIRLAAAAAILTHEKRAKGDVEPDGRVALSAAEIANDWRSTPAKGQRVAPTNQDGTKPHLARKRVKPLMQTAIERGLVSAEARTVPRTTDDGTRYEDTEWLIAPAETLKAQLNPWVRYEPAAPKTRKPRTITPPCPKCGEVHAILQLDYCKGCGALVNERTIEPKTAEECAWDNLSRTDSTPATPQVAAPQTLPASTRNRRDKLSLTQCSLPQPLHSRNVEQVIPGDFHNTPEEPAWLNDAPTWADVAPAQELYEAQQIVDFASHSAPDETKRALHDLGDQLAAMARQRGRTPVPKSQTTLSGPPTGVAGDDYWTNA